MKTTNTIEDEVSEGLQGRHIGAFLEQLRAARYSEVTLSKKRRILNTFAQWMKSKNIALANLDESAIAAFVKRSIGAPESSVKFERAVLRLLLSYLRGEAILRLSAPGNDSAIDHLHGLYVDYLRQDRGLARNSVLVYRRDGAGDQARLR